MRPIEQVIYIRGNEKGIEHEKGTNRYYINFPETWRTLSGRRLTLGVRSINYRRGLPLYDTTEEEVPTDSLEYYNYGWSWQVAFTRPDGTIIPESLKDPFVYDARYGFRLNKYSPSGWLHMDQYGLETQLKAQIQKWNEWLSKNGVPDEQLIPKDGLDWVEIPEGDTHRIVLKYQYEEAQNGCIRPYFYNFFDYNWHRDASRWYYPLTNLKDFRYYWSNNQTYTYEGREYTQCAPVIEFNEKHLPEPLSNRIRLKPYVTVRIQTPDVISSGEIITEGIPADISFTFTCDEWNSNAIYDLATELKGHWNQWIKTVNTALQEQGKEPLERTYSWIVIDKWYTSRLQIRFQAQEIKKDFTTELGVFSPKCIQIHGPLSPGISKWAYKGVGGPKSKEYRKTDPYIVFMFEYLNANPWGDDFPVHRVMDDKTPIKPFTPPPEPSPTPTPCPTPKVDTTTRNSETAVVPFNPPSINDQLSYYVLNGLASFLRSASRTINESLTEDRLNSYRNISLPYITKIGQTRADMTLDFKFIGDTIDESITSMESNYCYPDTSYTFPTESWVERIKTEWNRVKSTYSKRAAKEELTEAADIDIVESKTGNRNILRWVPQSNPFSGAYPKLVNWWSDTFRRMAVTYDIYETTEGEQVQLPVVSYEDPLPKGMIETTEVIDLPAKANDSLDLELQQPPVLGEGALRLSPVTPLPTSENSATIEPVYAGQIDVIHNPLPTAETSATIEPVYASQIRSLPYDYQPTLETSYITNPVINLNPIPSSGISESLMIKASFVTQTRDQYLGFTNSEFCPMKTYDITTGEQRFWIELYTANGEIGYELNPDGSEFITIEMQLASNFL